MKKKTTVVSRTLKSYGTVVVGAVIVDVRRRSGGKDRFLVKVTLPSERAECCKEAGSREQKAAREMTRDSSLPEKVRE